MNRRAWQMLAFAVVLGSTGWSQVTQRVSVSGDGSQGNADSGGVTYPTRCSVSADGRYVVFDSLASNLVPGDTNGEADVFVHDRLNGTTERVSVSSAGIQGNGQSVLPSISGDGRHVAFVSLARNLVPGDSNGRWDVFVHDRVSGETERVNVCAGGAQSRGDTSAYAPSISADGRRVTFQSGAGNLVPGDSNGHFQIFVYDRQDHTMECASVSTDGVLGNTNSQTPSISADGRYVAFVSIATNLVPGYTGTDYETYVRDRRNRTTTMVSVSSSGIQANSDSGLAGLSISADGRYVAFASYANNLVGGGSLSMDIYLRDCLSSVTTRESADLAGHPGNHESSIPSISADGRYVTFTSDATNLVPDDTNGTTDVFVRDVQLAHTERVSVSTSQAQGNGPSGRAYGISISLDGRYAAFDSSASNLVSGDTDQVSDIFVHDLHASGFTSLCDPGGNGVIACPCSNPPSSLGRGCDNSSTTGGATLAASGIAYLTVDNLAFTTNGETPSALSIVMQGSSVIPNGVVYGQGVRCLGGPLIRRLYIKEAVAGSITAPDLAAGDPTVSARSAAKGDVIQPGQSRWYLVYYRDPVVLGGCPASSTFNATQTGQVTWWP